HVAFSSYSYLDGLNGDASQLRSVPFAVRATDGRLWFSLTGDVVSVDLLHVFKDRLIPPVSVIRVISESGKQDASSAVNLSKGSRNIEIDYMAGSLSVPER